MRNVITLRVALLSVLCGMFIDACAAYSLDGTHYRARQKRVPSDHGSSIVATVRNEKTKEVIMGCVVMVHGTQIGAITDAEGRVELDTVPVGVCSLRVLKVEYYVLIIPNVRVDSGYTTVLSDLFLKERVIE